MSATAVAHKHHVAPDTALRWLRTNDIPIRPNQRAIAGDQLEEAIALRKQGWTWSQLGERYNRSHTAIRNAVVKAQLQATES